MKDANSTSTVLTQLHGKSSKVNLDKFRHDMLMWISVSLQAFVVIEEPKFRDMIADLSLDVANMLPKCADTIRSWILSQHKDQKAILIERLTQSRSRIHLSMDIWTTPSGNRSYLGIVANWCDADFEICNVLIALPPITGQHTGLNIAKLASDVIDTYGIGQKIGYCMLDSASNNDCNVTVPANEL